MAEGVLESESVRPLPLTKEAIMSLNNHSVTFEHARSLFLPLKTIARISGDVYIPRGVSAPALDNDILWEFQPKKMDGVLSQAQEMLCNAWRGTCSPNVECGMENLLPYAFVFVPPTNNYSLKAEGTSAESIATISKVNIVKRRMEAAYETLQLSSIVDVFSSNDLPRVAETLANIRHCLTAFVEGSVFEDVKCKDVVELERIRLELEEIPLYLVDDNVSQKAGNDGLRCYPSTDTLTGHGLSDVSIFKGCGPVMLDFSPESYAVIWQLPPQTCYLSREFYKYTNVIQTLKGGF
ncbi:Conserved oligomeric Golgi complex subunit 7 [Artemisia annua]|uniref:Conserved oligomeric Golgi complex subunit 7 n=1 Tax=Artemisia annua TaxID=35608 RepID=A0A2U1M677_ARTAN|nr:Conserved oligomeric Golgi complex subunit 7 [Artemisia annua]